jgi:hypothetical protein
MGPKILKLNENKLYSVNDYALDYTEKCSLSAVRTGSCIFIYLPFIY